MAVEFQILDWIQNIRTPAGDVFMSLVTKLWNAGILWIVTAVVLAVIPRTRKAGIMMMAALLPDVVICNGILKNLVGRVRPCDINTVIQLLVPRPTDFSFPSGHTAASFAAVSSLYFAGEKRLWKPVLAVAILIAFSRMYLYVHYPTDILGGIVVGIACGLAACAAVNAFYKNREINHNRR